MRSWIAGVPVLAVLLAAAACYSSSSESPYECDPTAALPDCPPGWFCGADERCHAMPGDGGADADADIDVRPDESGAGDEGAGCVPEECDDGDVCNGAEVCTVDGRCVATPPPDGDVECVTADGAPGLCDDGFCRPCSRGTCGNGVVDSGEDCDDGNSIVGDGCDGCCWFSCLVNAECQDDVFCNGAELCRGHRCVPGEPLIDGTICGDGMVCRGGACVVEAWVCTRNEECADARLCNGAEACDPETHLCVPGAPAPDGTACVLRDGGDGLCLRGVCIPVDGCGDGIVDIGEECDDGNCIDGDGCDNDGTWTCTRDIECDDARACDGAETCDLANHVCRAGTPLPDGTPCSTYPGVFGLCRSGDCIPVPCGDGTVDSSEECDDGNLIDGDGCDMACVFSCHIAADCPEVPDNPCTTDACVTGGTGQICRHTPNTDPCDDLDSCTGPDRCSDGSCRGTTIDADGDTYGPGAACGGDCDDGAAAIHPGAPEICNGFDDDCDGAVDEGAGCL